MIDLKENQIYYLSYIDSFVNRCYLDSFEFFGTRSKETYKDDTLGFFCNIKLIEAYDNKLGWIETNGFSEWWFISYDWIFDNKEDALNNYYNNLKIIDINDILT
jgi:hypothetical protein